jgi:cytochrome c oxidase cbb3-type subunit IV
MTHSTYEVLRHFADSWGLLCMAGVFLVLVLWPLRPGVRDQHDEAANSIFRDDHHG